MSLWVLAVAATVVFSTMLLDDATLTAEQREQRIKEIYGRAWVAKGKRQNHKENKVIGNKDDVSIEWYYIVYRDLIQSYSWVDALV